MDSASIHMSMLLRAHSNFPCVAAVFSVLGIATVPAASRLSHVVMRWRCAELGSLRRLPLHAARRNDLCRVNVCLQNSIIFYYLEV